MQNEVTADTIKRNQIRQFKFKSQYDHAHWKPELNETVCGEIVCDRYLIIKDENGCIVRFGDDMSKPPFFDAGGACIAKAGDFIAITFKGAGNYLVSIKNREADQSWWTVARDEFDALQAIDDLKKFGVSMVVGISTDKAIELSARV